MKKIYNSPAVEFVAMRSAFALCDGSSSPGGSGVQGDPVPAPKRRTAPF